jgi:hypothetical protein
VRQRLRPPAPITRKRKRGYRRCAISTVAIDVRRVLDSRVSIGCDGSGRSASAAAVPVWQLTPGEFEGLVFRVAWVEDRRVVRLQAPDGGLDTLLPDERRPGKAAHGWQAKRHTKSIDPGAGDEPGLLLSHVHHHSADRAKVRVPLDPGTDSAPQRLTPRLRRRARRCHGRCASENLPGGAGAERICDTAVRYRARWSSRRGVYTLAGVDVRAASLTSIRDRRSPTRPAASSSWEMRWCPSPESTGKVRNLRACAGRGGRRIRLICRRFECVREPRRHD